MGTAGRVLYLSCYRPLSPDSLDPFQRDLLNRMIHHLHETQITSCSFSTLMESLQLSKGQEVLALRILQTLRPECGLSLTSKEGDWEVRLERMELKWKRIVM